MAGRTTSLDATPDLHRGLLASRAPAVHPIEALRHSSQSALYLS